MPDIASLRFLVVDDEDFVRTLTSRVLGHMGAKEVAAASDGADALKHLDETDVPPDVILLDMSMPGMGGAEVLGELAGRDFKGAVILVSGEDVETLEFAQGLAVHRETNVLGYIVKPLKADALQEMLAKLD